MFGIFIAYSKNSNVFCKLFVLCVKYKNSDFVLMAQIITVVFEQMLGRLNRAVDSLQILGNIDSSRSLCDRVGEYNIGT